MDARGRSRGWNIGLPAPAVPPAHRRPLVRLRTARGPAGGRLDSVGVDDGLRICSSPANSPPRRHQHARVGHLRRPWSLRGAVLPTKPPLRPMLCVGTARTGDPCLQGSHIGALVPRGVRATTGDPA